MNADLYAAVLAKGGWTNLSERAKWRLTGADRIRYLNGQVTNEVRQVTADAALYACVTNLKGRIEADVFIHADGDSLLIDAEAPLRESLGVRLERYIIADDAVLEDITDAWELWHVFGAAADELIASEMAAAFSPIRSRRLGIPGVDLWLPAHAGPTAIAAPLLPPEDFEVFRILQGVPRYPHELNADSFPQEAGLETRAMSFTKGCYIGQEILSRIKTTGKMPRHMVAWQAVEGMVSAGETLFVATPEGGAKAIGTITSAALHPIAQTQTGLAYVRQGTAGPDSVLLVGNDVPRIAAAVKLSPVPNQ